MKIYRKNKVLYCEWGNHNLTCFGKCFNDGWGIISYTGGRPKIWKVRTRHAY